MTFICLNLTKMYPNLISRHGMMITRTNFIHVVLTYFAISDKEGFYFWTLDLSAHVVPTLRDVNPTQEYKLNLILLPKSMNKIKFCLYSWVWIGFIT